VIGHIRVSTDAQGEEGAGLEAQRKEIRRECERRGWQLYRIEEDVLSGRTMKRPGIESALARAGREMWPAWWSRRQVEPLGHRLRDVLREANREGWNSSRSTSASTSGRRREARRERAHVGGAVGAGDDRPAKARGARREEGRGGEDRKADGDPERRHPPDQDGAVAWGLVRPDRPSPQRRRSPYRSQRRALARLDRPVCTPTRLIFRARGRQPAPANLKGAVLIFGRADDLGY